MVAWARFAPDGTARDNLHFTRAIVHASERVADSAGGGLPGGLPSGRKRASDEAAEERILFDDNRQQVCTRIATAGVASGDNDAARTARIGATNVNVKGPVSRNRSIG